MALQELRPLPVVVPSLAYQDDDRPADQRVVVAYCHYGSVADDFAHCLMEMRDYDRRGQIIGRHWDCLLKSKSAYIVHARNEVVETFLRDTTADWLLFLDNDMVFPRDTLETMLSLADPELVPILAGLYLGPLQPFPDEPERTEYLPLWTYGYGGHERLQVFSVNFDVPMTAIHTCGMGCTILHRSVFERVGEAYAHDQWCWFGHDLIRGTRLGEDYTLCERARGLGIPLFGTAQIVCGHIKTHLLHPISYARERASAENPTPVAA